MNRDLPLDVPAIQAALAQLAHGYRELADVSRAQAEAMEGAWDADRLLAHAREKAQVMERIDSVDRGLSPLSGDWEALVTSLEEPQKGEVTRQLEELREALGEAIALEEKAGERMASRRTEIQGEFEKTTRARMIQQAYGPRKAPETRFVDREG